MIGIFFGTYKKNEAVHQAGALFWSLKQIEATDEFKVQNLQPLHISRARDTGYTSNKATSLSLADQKPVVSTTENTFKLFRPPSNPC